MLWPHLGLQGACSHTSKPWQRIATSDQPRNPRGLSYECSEAFVWISDGSFAPSGADEDVCPPDRRPVASEIRFGSDWDHAERTQRKSQAWSPKRSSLLISRLHTTQSHLCRPLTHLLKQGFRNKNVFLGVVVIHASIIHFFKKYNKKNMNKKVLEMQLYRVF